MAFDPEAGTLSSRFPILPGYLNPYGSMQGGFIAAAVDNTLGPLSMLVAPPNVTRRLEIKYSQAVTPDLIYILVEGKYLGIEGQYLKFNADVRAPAGNLLARARSYHWVTGQ
ncbi:MAG TPA: PaaI family thioesterase [Anaerolineales bacterium]|nr:PaaI family thioesterase [Anaerolineales bacterium]